MSYRNNLCFSDFASETYVRIQFRSEDLHAVNAVLGKLGGNGHLRPGAQYGPPTGRGFRVAADRARVDQVDEGPAPILAVGGEYVRHL